MILEVLNPYMNKELIDSYRLYKEYINKFDINSAILEDILKTNIAYAVKAKEDGEILGLAIYRFTYSNGKVIKNYIGEYIYVRCLISKTKEISKYLLEGLNNFQLPIFVNNTNDEIINSLINAGYNRIDNVKNQFVKI